RERDIQQDANRHEHTGKVQPLVSPGSHYALIPVLTREVEQGFRKGDIIFDNKDSLIIRADIVAVVRDYGRRHISRFRTTRGMTGGRRNKIIPGSQVV